MQEVAHVGYFWFPKASQVQIDHLFIYKYFFHQLVSFDYLLLPSFDYPADWDVYQLEEQRGVVFDVVLDVLVSETGDEGDCVWVAVGFGVIVTNQLNYLQQLPITVLMIHQRSPQKRLVQDNA
jgi:hypothetical protein